MKKKVLSSLLILALLIAKTPVGVFAVDNTNEPAPSDVIENIELDGKIGEWDPGNEDQPNFGDQDLEIEGTLPGDEDYFTISVTVPVAMEFNVFPSSVMAFGSFYSPEYIMKNNGSKTIVAKILSFDMDTSRISEDTTPLYIEEVVRRDGKTQMELNFCTFDDLNSNVVSKEIDLTKINSLTDEERKLYELSANEAKKVKFKSTNWELPKYESKKESAASNYTAVFEFSIK